MQTLIVEGLHQVNIRKIERKCRYPFCDEIVERPYVSKPATCIKCAKVRKMIYDASPVQIKRIKYFLKYYERFPNKYATINDRG